MCIISYIDTYLLVIIYQDFDILTDEAKFL